MKNALFGKDSETHSWGKCSRCGKDLIIDPAMGTAQSNHKFRFDFKHPPSAERPLSILMGVCGYVFSWEADLCDRCLYDLYDFIHGQPLFPSPVGCNQTCDGVWLPVEIAPDGKYWLRCDKCEYVVIGEVSPTPPKEPTWKRVKEGN